MATETAKEIGEVKKLMMWLIGLFVAICIVVLGGMFTILNSADKEIKKEVDKKAGTELLIRYEKVNQTEHKEIKQNQIRFEDKVDHRFDKLEESMDKSFNEIKEMIRKD